MNVNIAARIEAKARPNTITLSGALVHYLPNIPFRSLGSTALRGVSQEIELYEYQPPTSMSVKDPNAIPVDYIERWLSGSSRRTIQLLTRLSGVPYPTLRRIIQRESIPSVENAMALLNHPLGSFCHNS